METNYELYDTDNFLDDPFFIDWIKHGNPKDDLFWDSWIQNNPPNIKAFREAGVQLRMILSAERIDIGDAAETMVWERIQSSINNPVRSVENDHSGSITRSMRKYWWAVAAILLVMATGSFFLWNQRTGRELAKTDDLQQPLSKDILPGGNKAILTLADGTKVALDTANNGALTRQGGVSLVKMDGQLSYNTEGSNSKEVLYNTVATPKGGQFQLTLADGTKVWLNAASSLRYPTSFTGSERKVEITGEAYFEVAKNKAMPFKVDVAGRGEVEVLGTHFNINAYDDEPNVSTSLLEGSIRFTELQTREVKTIVPGEQVLLGADGRMELKKHPDMESVVAWKNGSFDFSKQDIVSVMRQISRWYNVDVVYSGVVSKETFTGIVNRNSEVSEVLSLIEESGVRFKIEGRKIIVLF